MILSQFPDQFTDFNHLFRIKADGWLVQNQHFRVSAQSLGDPHPLTVSLAQMSDNPVLNLADLADSKNLLHMALLLPGSTSRSSQTKSR